MDWTAFGVSLRLAAWTMLLLVPAGVWLGRTLAYKRFPGRNLVEALFTLPLVLPPTVMGYYLLVAFGGQSFLGRMWEGAFGQPLAFTFNGLLLASVIFNLPFAIQPVQRAFEAIPREVRDAAACCGLAPGRTLWRIELPLAWPGILSALVLTFAHTLGEFGVVLMVGGSIPGETRTIAIALYDRAQALDTTAAGVMSMALLAVSLLAVGLSYATARHA